MAADWSATENFDSYTAGGLNGDNGGSGWSAAWVSNAAGIVSITQFQSSPNGLLCSDTAAASIDASRTLTTGVTTGIYRVYIYAGALPTTNLGYYPTLFYDGASTIRFFIGWGTDATNNSGNNITLSNFTTWITLSTSALAATWYYVDVQFDQAGSQARASFNGGPWSSFLSQAFTQIDKIRVTTANGNAVDQGYYIDSIGVGTGPAVASTAVSKLTLLGVS